MYLNLLIFSSIFLKHLIAHKIYYIQEEQFLDWNMANKKCETMGMNFASIKTEEEWKYLKEFIQKDYGRIYAYWLGAYKINGSFVWIASDEKITKFFWHEGEPNNNSGHEKCIHTWDGDFDWNDNDCERQLPFICDLEV